MPDGLQFGKDERQGLDTDRRIVGDFVDELYDREYLEPGEAVLSTATLAAVTTGANIIAPVISFANAAESYAMWTLPVRDEWVKHYARLRFWYTSDTASTANISLDWRIYAHTDSTLFATDIELVSASYPGPAAASGILVPADLTFDTNPISTQTHRFLTVSLRRDGVGDAHAGAFYFLHGRLIFYKA